MIEDYRRRLFRIDLRCVCISDWQAGRPDAKIVPGLDESGHFGMKTETMKCESSKSMREERVDAQPVQSDGQTDASAITSEMIEDYRRRLFRIYLQHAPEHIGKIPDLLQEHGSMKASLDALVARALWEHLTALAAVRSSTLKWDVQRQTRNESYVRWGKKST